jgi:hypothetical protein
MEVAEWSVTLLLTLYLAFQGSQLNQANTADRLTRPLRRHALYTHK